jgi:cell division transport system permease protein
MRSWPRVVEVDDAGRWSERFRALLGLLDTAGVFLGAILIFAAFTVSSLGVRLVAANHVAEREIQHLVGAPESFIRAPYLLAGGSLGLLGACIAFAGLGAFYYAAASVPSSGWPIPIHAPAFFAPAEIAALLAGAIFIGVAGSWAGTRKSLLP